MFNASSYPFYGAVSYFSSAVSGSNVWVVQGCVDANVLAGNELITSYIPANYLFLWQYALQFFRIFHYEATVVLAETATLTNAQALGVYTFLNTTVDGTIPNYVLSNWTAPSDDP